MGPQGLGTGSGEPLYTAGPAGPAGPAEVCHEVILGTQLPHAAGGMIDGSYTNSFKQ